LMGTAEALPFPAAKVQRKPQELSAEILRSLRADVQAQFGFLPATAVVAVPALFEVPQSSATLEAALLAGFARVELIQEPVASALAAGWTTEDSGGQWLVYDLGGGTFDASLLASEGGMLRVVGHDGDNFLGGRDIDSALVDWAIESIAASGGPSISREDPKAARIVRRLKFAAEEAKIELSRTGRATLLVPDLVDGFEVNLPLTPDVLEAAAGPVIDKSIVICNRLLQAHRVQPGTLSRIVLVGGPTAIGLLRKRIAQDLSAPLAPMLDPMTLVAQGAAVYAATAGLDARPAAEAKPRATARKLALRYPAMSSDLKPHVVGKLIAEAAKTIVRLQLVRGDAAWKSAPIEPSAEGAFAAQVDLLPHRANEFAVLAFSADGSQVEVEPARITIVQGLTITDPPLSRSIGVARADDTVQEYFRRGSPLPARRTFVLRTVETMGPQSGDHALRVPIVQGESHVAHLCRLIGTLEIDASELRGTLPAGSSIELTLEVDRGGRLSANALAPALNQLFSKVAQLVVPNVAPETIRATLASFEERLRAAKSQAFSSADAEAVAALSAADARIPDIRRDAAAAAGGDADAAQRARRNLLELDEAIEAIEARMRWPEVDQDAQERVANAYSWVAVYGTEAEQRMLDEAATGIQRARERKDVAETERQLRLVSAAMDAAFFRSPNAWRRIFEHYASRADAANDLPRAQELVSRGRAAAERRDEAELRTIAEELKRLLPVDELDRRLGFNSSVR
jgi:molecular chaperone DnaK